MFPWVGPAFFALQAEKHLSKHEFGLHLSMKIGSISVHSLLIQMMFRWCEICL